MQFKLALQSYYIGDGFRKVASNSLTLATNLVTLIGYGVRTGGDFLRKTAPFMQVASMAGIALSSISLALSTIEFGFAIKNGYNNYKKSKKLKLDEANYTRVEEKANELSEKGLLDRLLRFETDRIDLQKIEVSQERTKIVLGVAAATLLTASGVLGFAAAFTHGTTLGVLIGVSIGISVMTIGFMIYQNRKEKKLKREREGFTDKLSHLEIRAIVKEIEGMKKQNGQREQLQLIRELLGIKEEAEERFLRNPSYYLEKHFRSIILETQLE